MACVCGSKSSFDDCCGPFLKGEKFPQTAEQLMRSRYTAYTRGDIDYLRKTLAPESRGDFDAKGAQEWAEKSTWKGLEVLSTEKGDVKDKKGTVEFTAKYELNGEEYEHHEVSRFRKTQQGQWFFVEGEFHVHRGGEGHEAHVHPVPQVRESPKVGRNDPCQCGSGKKYKKCHGAA